MNSGTRPLVEVEGRPQREGRRKVLRRWERAALRMADTAFQTAANSLGQEVIRKTKVKRSASRNPS